MSLKSYPYSLVSNSVFHIQYMSIENLKSPILQWLLSEEIDKTKEGLLLEQHHRF